MRYKLYITENCKYRDFVWMFDADLGLYVMSTNPVYDNKKFVFINKASDNEKDSIADILDYIDDYYNSDDDKYDSLDLESLTESDSLHDLYGDLFVVKLVRSDDTDEIVEFSGEDAIINAQEYIDRLKIDNDESYKSASLLDEDDNILDIWKYNSR